jgi:branched-chain amino acid transport system substrate-binding protein
MSKVRFVWMSVLALIVLAACSAPRPTKGQLIVYVAVPLSGFQANGGQTVLGGARLAAEEINRAGGLLGYELVVAGKDDESDDDVAVSVANEIAEAIQAGQAVLGVIGHLNSGQTLAAMDVYGQLPIVIITPTASETSLTQKGYQNFFRINANNATQARVDAEFMVDTLGARKVAVVFNDDPYGIDLAQLVSRDLEERGAQVVARIQVQVEQSQYDPQVAQIAAAQPDTIFYAGYEVETPYLRRQLVDAGITVPFLASDGAFLSATIDEAEGRAEDMYVSNFAPEPKTVVDANWVKNYQAVEFRNPDTYSINGYSALKVMAAGARQAGSLEGGQVAAAIRALQMDTPMGQISYEANGDLRDQRIFIFQVRDDKFIQVSQ